MALLTRCGVKSGIGGLSATCSKGHKMQGEQGEVRVRFSAVPVVFTNL